MFTFRAVLCALYVFAFIVVRRGTCCIDGFVPFGSPLFFQDGRAPRACASEHRTREKNPNSRCRLLVHPPSVFAVLGCAVPDSQRNRNDDRPMQPANRQSSLPLAGAFQWRRRAVLCVVEFALRGGISLVFMLDGRHGNLC